MKLNMKATHIGEGFVLEEQTLLPSRTLALFLKNLSKFKTAISSSLAVYWLELFPYG